MSLFAMPMCSYDSNYQYLYVHYVSMSQLSYIPLCVLCLYLVMFLCLYVNIELQVLIHRNSTETCCSWM